LIALSIPLIILLYLGFAPYTKVEESFNIQATHDILTYGIPFRNVYENLKRHYDHLTFSGAVPRTFLGPLTLAAAAWPFSWLVEGLEKQILVRAILGVYNAFSILAFRNGIAKAYGRDIANWYILFQASQFHVMYYASRTLPNFFAFGLCTLALRNLIPSVAGGALSSTPRKRYQQGLILLTTVGVVFRSEVAILLGTQILWLLIHQRVTFSEIISAGLTGLAIGLCLTLPIDSYFWQQDLLWPELNGFLYNVMEGKSADWGSSPFLYYLNVSLPRLLLNPLTYLVCIPLALTTPALQNQALDMVIPNLTFILIYSLQPHKEWRFIVYTIPAFTAVAAMGASWIWNRRTKSYMYRLFSLALVVSVIGSFIASFGMLMVSRLNYPGAGALNYLHETVAGSKAAIRIHMDPLSCMTGITRFLQIPMTGRTQWHYDKTENDERLLHPAFWSQFDYVLTESPEKAIGGWELIKSIEGFTGIGLVRPEKSALPKGKGLKSLKGLIKAEDGDWKARVFRLWSSFEEFLKTKVTRGWWVQARMEPQIRILRSTKEWVIPQKFAKREDIKSYFKGMY
jgi:alpha-1,6-mannosyltransferase